MNFSVISFEASPLMAKIIHKLAAQGIVQDKCLVAAHTKKDFSEAFRLASVSDNIFILGGLGYGAKSFVKETLAELLNLPMTKNEIAEECLKNYAALKNKTYTKAAYNSVVSYPGGFECYKSSFEFCSARLSFGGRDIYLLSEDDGGQVFDTYIYNQILKKRGHAGKQFFFKLYGLSKAEILERAAFKRTRSCEMHVTVDPSCDALVTLTFGHRVNETVINDTLCEFCTAFKDDIYADSEITLEEQAVKLLTVRNRVISVAESVTGGLITSKIISVSGASKVIKEAFVCYSNQSKVARLNVSTITLSNYGAVSDDVAYEMAVGLLSNGCSLALATTGIADSGGEETSKPVGLCYMSLGDERGVHVHKTIYSGTRNRIREQIACDALFRVIKHLQ